ncbi:AMP-binding protein, partial [Rhodococcus rhodochrous]
MNASSSSDFPSETQPRETQADGARSRASRPERAPRPERASRPERAPRPERTPRPERGARPERAARPARGERARGRRGVLLPQLLVSAVESAGDAVAVVEGSRSLSYRELDAVSSRWARWLIGRGVGPGDAVVVAVPRSLESVMVLWAVAKSGATFVPVDPGYPAERVQFMVADS